MEERPFKDKTIKPEDATLKIALGNRYVDYQNRV